MWMKINKKEEEGEQDEVQDQKKKEEVD